MSPLHSVYGFADMMYQHLIGEDRLFGIGEGCDACFLLILFDFIFLILYDPQFIFLLINNGPVQL